MPGVDPRAATEPKNCGKVLSKELSLWSQQTRYFAYSQTWLRQLQCTLIPLFSAHYSHPIDNRERMTISEMVAEFLLFGQLTYTCLQERFSLASSFTQ